MPPRPITTPSAPVPAPQAEEVYMVTHCPAEGVAVVEIVYGTTDAQGAFVRDARVPYTCERIVGEDYQRLLSADGGGDNPGKPAGTFRISDLWPHLDRVRAARPRAPR